MIGAEMKLPDTADVDEGNEKPGKTCADAMDPAASTPTTANNAARRPKVTRLRRAGLGAWRRSGGLVVGGSVSSSDLALLDQGLDHLAALFGRRRGRVCWLCIPGRRWTRLEPRLFLDSLQLG
jgi:hypothetical protein